MAVAQKAERAVDDCFSEVDEDHEDDEDVEGITQALVIG